MNDASRDVRASLVPEGPQESFVATNPRGERSRKAVVLQRTEVPCRVSASSVLSQHAERRDEEIAAGVIHPTEG